MMSPAPIGPAVQEALEPIERAPRAELRALQLERLRWSVHQAYRHVEHYRRSFDEAGAHPSDLETLEDLARFPFLLKQNFRDNYPFGLFAVPREKLARVHASSGTTAKPTVVGYTANDVETWASLVARSIRAAGGRPGDAVHVAYGYGLFTGGLGAHYGAERLGCTVIPASGGRTARQVQLVEDLRPRIIMLPPTSRSMRRMTRISGRSDDMLVVRGVNVFPGRVEEIALKCAGVAPLYQLEMTSSGSLDVMTVHAELASGADRERVRSELSQRIKDYIGLSVVLEVHEPRGLERSGGKARRVVDRRSVRYSGTAQVGARAVSHRRPNFRWGVPYAVVFQ